MSESEEKGLTIARWAELMTQFGLNECSQTYNSLVRAYTAPDRHYHNEAHIATCLSHVDSVRALLRHPHEVEFAIWFHDLVYAPVAAANERESAEGAQNFLLGQDVEEAVATRVYHLVLATDHQHAIKNKDMAYLLDIDLATLGADDDAYDTYDAAIAKEFRLIPEFVFHTRRGQFLRGLLARDRIYRTDFFHDRFENQARANLKRTIDALTV